jgi:hypothetical protein
VAICLLLNIKLFPILKMEFKENKELCQAKCRDGTECLNKARYGEYCWRHRKQVIYGKIMDEIVA